MSEPHVSAKAIFLQALELITIAEREEYLETQCGNDAGLRREVEELLRHQGDVGSFLESPPTAVVETADELHSLAPPQPSLGFLSPPSRADSLGRLGHYEILEVVGSGGMGVVLRAFDERLQRIVAIKAMAPALAASAASRQRFAREAQAAAAVNHDNVVDIYGVEESDPVPYIVMEYVAGISLEDKLQQQGSLSLKEILRIGLQTADGLAAAHRQGLVHRDVKPANILLENGVERVKITDFGLARAADDVSITQTGVIAGTPAYMSPEQARGEAVDYRSDLFSLGSVLYALCTGRTPFRSSTSLGMLRQVCDEQPHAIRDLNPDIPEWLCALVERLHAKLPDARFQSAAELAEVLGECLAHVQQATTPMPSKFASKDLKPRTQVRKLSGSARRWVAGTAAALVLLLFGLSLTDASGLTNVAATVIRVFTPDGTLVVETDDPAVKVTVEGDGGLVITGAGPQEVRLRPGSYKLKADKDGKPVPLERDLVSIAVGGREVVKIKLESPNGTSSAQLFDAQVVRLFKGHTGSVKDVAFSPDGKQALSGSGYPQGDRTVRLWDIATGKQIGAFETSGTQILTVCFSPDGRLVAGGGLGSAIRIWETNTGRQVASLETNTEVVEDLVFSPDGCHLLCATHKRAFATRLGLAGWGKAQLWDVKSEALVWEFESEGWLTAGGFVQKGERIVVAGRQTGAGIYLLDRETGKELQRFGLGKPADIQIEELAVSHDRRLVATASESGYLCLWDPSAGDRPVKYRSNMGNLRSVAFSPDDSKLVCGSGEGETGRIDLIDVSTLQAVDSIEHPSGLVWSVAYAPDGRHVFSAGGFAQNQREGDYALRLWQLPKGSEPNEAGTIPEPQPFVVLGKNGFLRTFGSLSEAVQSASGGDTIEIRGNGPFVSQPISINGTLRIRAGAGFHPVIKLDPQWHQRDGHLIASNSRLALEGLELHRAPWDVQENVGRKGVVRAANGLWAANCRFLSPIAAHDCAVLVLHNCEVLADDTGISGRYRPGARFKIENCLFWTNGSAMGPNDVAAFHDPSVQIKCSTFVGSSFVWLLLQSPVPIASSGAPTSMPIRLEVEGSVLDTQSLLGFSQTTDFLKLADLLKPAQAESALIELLQWRGKRNAYTSDSTFVRWFGGPNPQPPRGPASLEEWRIFWKSPETGSVAGQIQFEGGNRFRSSGATPYQLTPVDFRLRPDSAGYRAGPDGKDLGADVDLVGPGGAYERWKQTPGYQEWFRETKQTAMEGVQDERAAQIDNYVLQANEQAAGGRLDQAAEAFDTALNMIADPNAYGPERLRVVDQFVASDELFLRIVKLRPDDRTLWGLRGHHLAKAARWEDSIACYQKQLDLGPDGAGLWEIYSLALLAGNDQAGYRSVCEKMLAGFANNGDPLEAGHAAMAMAIVPDSVQDKQLAFGLAERAVQGNPDQFWWTNLAYAAWLYRLDRLEEALVALAERKNKDYPECSFCFLAMAHHRLGHTEEARRYADAVRQRKSAWSDTLPWYDRVRVEKLIVEMDSVLAAEPDQSPALQAEDTKTPATR